MATASHLIVLIPGFLGFDRLGDFEYFRATVGDAIRAGLGATRSTNDVAIRAVTTNPTGSLESRQTKLIDQLYEILEVRPGVRLHLVGHSTGGLDAELLFRTPLLSGTASLRDRAAVVRSAVRSIVTLSAPLSGTTVSDSPIARVSAIRSLQDVVEALRSKLLFQVPSIVGGALTDLAAGVLHDEAAYRLLFSALHKPHDFKTYVLEVLLQGSLAVDLSPTAIAKLLAGHSEDGSLAQVHRARFLTIARANKIDTDEGRLFTRFYEGVRDAARPDPAIDAVGSQLTEMAQTGKLTVIGDGTLPSPIDVRASDGIVNTARQVFLSATNQPAELARVKAIVIADHIDVIGYFPGMNNTPNGFLSSGSKFREAQFQTLYRSIASEVRRAM